MYRFDKETRDRFESLTKLKLMDLRGDEGARRAYEKAQKEWHDENSLLIYNSPVSFCRAQAFRMPLHHKRTLVPALSPRALRIPKQQHDHNVWDFLRVGTLRISTLSSRSSRYGRLYMPHLHHPPMMISQLHMMSANPLEGTVISSS